MEVVTSPTELRRFSQETPLDWESEDESEAPENGEVGSLDADTDTEKR